MVCVDSFHFSTPRVPSHQERALRHRRQEGRSSPGRLHDARSSLDLKDARLGGIGTQGLHCVYLSVSLSVGLSIEMYMYIYIYIICM